MRYGMVIDLKRCFGCHACSVACKQKNATPPNVFWSRVEVEEVGKYPNAYRKSKPVLCMHCDDAACVTECPYDATYKREDGLVLIRQEKCIGCNTCIAACPYGVRYSDYGRRESYFPNAESTPLEEANAKRFRISTVTKCTFCVDKISEGEEPSCVQTCPTKARIFGDLDSSEMQNLIRERGGYQDKPEKGTGPCVYYLPE